CDTSIVAYAGGNGGKTVRQMLTGFSRIPGKKGKKKDRASCKNRKSSPSVSFYPFAVLFCVNSSCRTCRFAGSAVYAGICVDFHMVSAHGNSAYRTFAFASTT